MKINREHVFVLILFLLMVYGSNAYPYGESKYNVLPVTLRCNKCGSEYENGESIRRFLSYDEHNFQVGVIDTIIGAQVFTKIVEDSLQIFYIKCPSCKHKRIMGTMNRADELRKLGKKLTISLEKRKK